MRASIFLLWILIVIPSLAQETPYFQQEVNYTIAVKLNDSTHTLSGRVDMEYHNNSRDALSFIYIHLWPNAYKSEYSAMSEQHLYNGDYRFYFSDEKDRGGIDSLAFKINEQQANWLLDSLHEDIAKLILPESLKPGQSIKISTPFRVKIPSGRFSRLGHIGQSYQITQWYPKPAVYDRDGWHTMPYLTQGEFYSEFGKFDVSITLPSNYVVGATGDLQNKKEVKWLHDLAEKTQKTIEEKGFDSGKAVKRMEHPKSSKDYKTLRYIQSKVHDFAWFADKRYHVAYDTVKLERSGKVVDCWAMFTNAESHLWKNSLEYIKDGLKYYSKWNGDYPYQHCTAVDGTISAGGGMEYPNITVIGYSGNARTLETTIVHEVGHNWFYGILGSNERDHAWMDEGLNTLNETRYLETKYPDTRIIEEFLPIKGNLISKFRLDIFKNKSIHEISYLLNARRNYDQPIELPSPEYTSINYGGIVYSKSGIVFDYLLAFLGDDLFDQCMQAYFEKWKFKHPQPKDLRAVFEETTGRDLSWFFDDLIQTTKTIDFKLKSVKKGEWGNYEIKVKSKGEINGPFVVAGMRDDSVVVQQWYESVPDGRVTLPNAEKNGGYDRVVIDPLWEIPEINRLNNMSRLKGPFKKAEKLRLQFLAGIEDPYRSTLYYTPVFAWNEHDGFMTGLALYNSVFPRKKFEFSVLPFYAWKSKELTGMGNVAYNFSIKHNHPWFQNVRLEADLKRFSYNTDLNPYTAIRSGADFELRRKRLRFNPQQHILLKHTLVDAQQESFLNYFDVAYTFHLKKPFYRLGAKLNNRYGETTNNGSFVNTDLVTRHTFSYGSQLKKIRLRSFIGYFWEIENATPANAYQLAGQNGASDYTFEHWFLGRGTQYPNLLNQQMIFNQGGFRTPTPIVSGDWMVSFNLDIDLPWFAGVGLFADLGFYPVTTISSANQFVPVTSTDNAFDFGVRVDVFGKFLGIYIPLAYSDQIQSYFDLNSVSFLQRIRFTLAIPQINPLKHINSIGE